MGGCSAINCTNHSRKKDKMYNFPADIVRRKKWTINCRREGWEPTRYAQLCSDHFEESQFELNRTDGKKLKQTAVPTLFNIPNPPPQLTDKRIKGIGRPKPNSILGSHLNSSDQENNHESERDLKRKVLQMEKEIENLKNAAEEKDRALKKFFSDEQIGSLHIERRSISHWNDEAILKALKIRFALGKHGFNYLRETGYPLPSYSTLNRRISHLKLNFGLLNSFFFLLKAKVESMDESEKNCCLLVDEMQISHFQDFDVSTKSFVGNTTLGKPGIANHYMVVKLRGLKTSWKQVVAHELTGPSTDGSALQNLITETVNAATNIGLRVRGLTSDMGSSNQAMWSSLGVFVSRKDKQTSFGIGSETIHTLADVPHLLKNMRGAFLSRSLILPDIVVSDHDLPCKVVSSHYLKQLWNMEITSNSGLRSLHHLKKEHLFPTHFSKMNVATAVQLFSIKTAAALEKAVTLQQVNKEGLSAAWWIRFIAQWFEIMTARNRKQAITSRNKSEKFKFLSFFISVMQSTQLGKGWKPLQTGMILSTMSVMKLTEELFSEGYTFFLPSRLTQDALENVFGQVRRKAGSKPTGLQAKGALKLICISQFISDIKQSNYASDSDFHLLDSTLNLCSSAGSNNVFNNLNLPDVSSASSSKTSLSIPAEENDIYYIAGATLNAILKKKSICEPCLIAVRNTKDSAEPGVPRYRTILTEYCDMGGLKRPESGLYRVCREAERAFMKYKDYLLSHEISMDKNFIQMILNNCSNVLLPTCCKLKEIIINHYLVIRCNGLKESIINKKAQEVFYGSASANKKQKIA